MNLETKLAQVRDEYLRRMTGGDASLLRQIEGYVTQRSGKMLRPRMALLAAATEGEAVFESRRTLLVAVAVEMLHNASLMHDDVVDQADSRRGLPSVNARWGNKAAVLVGDYLLTSLMRLLNELDDNDAARRINDTVMAMVESELRALASDGTPTTQEQYLAIIDGKTARLFATAAALGHPKFEEFGLHYGRHFQLADDINDNEITPWTADMLRQEEAIIGRMNAEGLGLPLPLASTMQ